jgi:hypothetical protein
MRVRNALIAAGALLAVAITVAVVVLAADAPVAEVAAPTPTPTTAPSPSPTPAAPAPTPTPAATPTPTPTPEPLEGPRPDGIDELADEVAELRRLPVLEPLDARTVPRADLGARFAELARAELEPDEVAADERLLAALRLIPPGVDLLAVLEAFYSEQVLGMYATEEQVLYIGADGPQLSAAQRITAAHEITHALQDQHWRLRDLLDLDEALSDRALAALALVEGDAVLVQELWAARHLTPADRVEAQQEALEGSGDALAQAPRYVRESVLFPYRAGPLFVRTLLETGGFEAVDAAFEDLPTSTAEILDPERYLAGWTPEEVDVTADPGAGWVAGSAYEFGAFDLRELLQPLGNRAVTVAGGWAGGTVRHWLDGDGDAVALALRFEDAGTASEACDALPAWYAAVADGVPDEGSTMQGDRDWLAWTCTELEVRAGLAPDTATAAALAAP